MTTPKTGPQARRPRPGIVPSLSAILQAFDDWEIDAKHPDGGLPYDYKVQWIYSAPGSATKIEYTRKEFDGYGDGDNAWPRPGIYEIHVLDSNDDLIVDPPFRGQHGNQDSLAHRRDDGNPLALYAEMQEQARVNIRDAEARARAAEKRAEDARAKLQNKDEQLAKTMGELSRARLAEAAATAAKDLAEGRFAALQEEYDELERSTDELEPHIAYAVDHFADRCAVWLGLEAANSANRSQPSADNGTDASGEDANEPPRGNKWMPPPPGAERPEDYRYAFYDIVRNPYKLQTAIEEELLTWEQARVLIWLITKIDMGDRPPWENAEEWAEACRIWDEANGGPPGTAAAAE